MSEWISVKERLPDIWQTVLVARKFCGIQMEFLCTDGKWVCDDNFNKKYKPVTHWMPLPEPPVAVAEYAMTTATLSKTERVHEEG